MFLEYFCCLLADFPACAEEYPCADVLQPDAAV